MKIGIEHNILRHYLRNVRFINGTAYAGKSTMCKMLAEKHNMLLCGENYECDVFRRFATEDLQPNFCYQRTDWQAFLCRSPEAYDAWITGSSRELAEFEIAELIRVSADRLTIVDTNIPVDILRLIAEPHQVALMLCPQAISVDSFFDREDEDKQFLLGEIAKADDPAAMMANFRACLALINSPEHYDEFVQSGFFTIIREDTTRDTRQEVLAALEKHFLLV